MWLNRGVLILYSALCIGLSAHAQPAPRQSAVSPPGLPATQMPAPKPNDTLKSVEGGARPSCAVFAIWGAETPMK